MRKKANELFNSVIGKDCYIKKVGSRGMFVKPVRVRVLDNMPTLYFEYRTYPNTYGFIKYTDLSIIKVVEND